VATDATTQQVRDLANTIALQADAIATGTGLPETLYARTRLLLQNAGTLAHWAEILTKEGQPATVTDAQAQEVLDAVVARYQDYFEPAVDTDYGNVIVAADTKPIIQRDERGHALISWEHGPSDWAFQVTQGGSTEEHRVLIAAANEEFGGSLKAAEPKPVKFPDGVHVEPYYSFVLGVYPA
jgi:hypothetical protein